MSAHEPEHTDPRDPHTMSRRQLMRHTAWFGAAVGLTVVGGELLSHVGGTPIEPGEWRWDQLDCLVLSPGVPFTHPAPHPVVEMAKEAGVEIICDIELLWRETQDAARFVAVTGTNGKSTTTALLGHVLAVAGPVSVGGNI